MSEVRTMKTSPKFIVLDLRDSHLNSRKFVKAVSSFFSLLSDVSSSVAGQKNAVEWLVRVKEGSVQIIAEPKVLKGDASIGTDSISAVRRGVVMMEKSDERPPAFNDSALKNLRILASLGNGNGDGPTRIKVGKKTSLVTLHSVQNIKNILMPARTLDGSVEGRLTVVSSRKGYKVQIDDLLTEKVIECNVNSEQLKEALNPDHFNSRVIAFGEVQYRRDGEPTSVLVREFRWLKSKDKLPSYKDMRDIL